MAEENIRKEISALEKEGYLYLQEWTTGFHTPDRFKLPSETILDETELNIFLKTAKLEFGNTVHIETIRALHYQELIFSDEYELDRFSYGSFIDKEDEARCKRKYNKTKT